MPNESSEWYRAWRHEELAAEQRAAVDARFRRREAVRRIIGDLFIVAAIVMLAWSMQPLFG